MMEIYNDAMNMSFDAFVNEYIWYIYLLGSLTSYLTFKIYDKCQGEIVTWEKIFKRLGFSLFSWVMVLILFILGLMLLVIGIIELISKFKEEKYNGKLKWLKGIKAPQWL